MFKCRRIKNGQIFSIGIHAVLLMLLNTVSPDIAAQNRPDFNIPANIPRPCWVDKIDWNRPNIIEIDSLVKSCPAIAIRREVNGEPEEDPYRNALRRWLRSGNIFIASDGQIRVNVDSGRINFQRSVDQQREYQLKMAQSQALVWSRNTPSVSTGVSSWSVLGPVDTYMSGQKRTSQANIYCLAVAPSNSNILFCGSETGIIFKSIDKGLNWVSVSDALAARSPASIVVDPTDERKVYVALNGVGTIIKSTDGGTNWATLSTYSGGVAEQMVINPTTGRILTASANGIYYSDNEGTSWTKATTSIAPGTYIYDIALNPGDPSIVYAVSQINASSTKDLVMYRSTNNGESFTAISLPANTSTSGARLSVTTADAGYVYCITLQTDVPKLLKSIDHGVTWSVAAIFTGTGLTGTNTTNGMSNGQGYYDLAIMVSPSNAAHVIVGTTSMYKSTDGGVNFSPLGGYVGSFYLHPDVQWMAASGSDSYIATDGGVNHSSDFFTSTSNFTPRLTGLTASDNWGFGQGWSEDILVAGRYHNGNAALYDLYGGGNSLSLGGGEDATGHVFQIPGKTAVTGFRDLGSTLLHLPATVSGSMTYASHSNTLWPSDYWYGEFSSELVQHPQYSNVFFVGNGKSLWKSTNYGLTYNELKNFGVNVYRFEVCRSNPNYIYLCNATGIFRTVNGGTDWTQLSLPSGVTYKSYNSDLAVNPTNELELVFCMSQGASGKKVFKSSDGGATWINYTGSMLSNESIGYIQWQGGTSGGLYAIGISSTARVFYRDAGMTDWVDYGSGLPNNVNASRGAQLFYRDNKLRISGNRGFWETPLYAQGLPQAMPMSNKQYVSCSKDTVVFKDYSILNYAGASWNWSFPGASYVSSTTASEVKVTYPGPGNYSVSLTVTDAASHSNTTTIADMISFTANNCPLDSFPGKALRLPYDGVYYSIGTANINSNTFTISCWIRPDGLQQSFAQLIAHDAYPGSSYGFGLGFAFDGYNPNLKLCYTSKESGYWNATSAKPDTGRWNHVALVYEPNNVFIYLNGVRYTANSGAMPVVDLSQSPFYINKDIHNQGGKYKGEVDEIKIYNYALSQSEIREKMHLIERTGLSETGLLKYVQFNIMDASTSSVYELMDGTPVSLASSSVLVNSAAPVGTGTSYRKTVSTGGQHTFTGTGAQLFLPAAAGSTYPNGEVVAFRLSSLPTDLPDAPNAVHMGERFIFNNYGTNASFTTPDSIRFEGVTLPSGHDVAFGYKLYKVSSGKLSADGWGASLGTGITLSRTSSTAGHLSFSGTGITSFSQFVVSVPTGTNAWVGTTGNWSAASNWSNGTRPTGTTDIEVNTGIPTLDVDFTLPAGKTLSMGGSGALVIAPAKTLTIGGSADFGGRPVTFRSDATGTAQFGNMTGTLTGATNVTVERYLPARRAYRLISAAVSTAGSVRQHWMEGATPGLISGYPYTGVSVYNPAPGYGTQITGVGGNANGFDATITNNPSMFTFDHSTQSWSGLTSTAGTMNAGAAYRIFIRGDRSIDLGQSSPSPTSTVLRSTGSLVTGSQSPAAMSSTANGWTLVGNPYQSVVDMTAVTRNNLSDYYYIWDPNLGSRGAYVAYNLTSRISSNGASAMNQYLQPGQAFFVQTATAGSTQLQFTEAAKGAAAEQTSTQGISAAGQRLSIMLYQRDSLVRDGIPVDGLRVIFGPGHQNEVDGRDAMKMTNADEGISVDRGGRLLCMEFRSPYDSATIIPLNVTGYTRSQYLLKLSWEGSMQGSSGVSAWLEDRHLGTRILIDPASASVVEIPFTIAASQPGSGASDRFRVVFGRSKVDVSSSPTIDQSSALRIDPNPVEGGSIRLRFSGLSEGLYELRLVDLNGRVLEQRQFRSDGLPGMWNWRPERPWGSGTYLLECRSGEHRFIFKFIKP